MANLEWIERYNIRGTHHEGWAVIHIDSKGFLGIVSDYGNFSYHWTAFGDDFKRFLLSIDEHYLHGKLSSTRSIYDGEATERAIKSHILDQRRSKRWPAERARDEWELLREHEVDHHTTDGFSLWYRDTSIDDAYELHEMKPEPQCTAFCQKVWPHFITALKKGEHDRVEGGQGLLPYREGILKQLLADWNEGSIDADVLLEQAFDRAVSFMQGNPRALPE